MTYADVFQLRTLHNKIERQKALLSLQAESGMNGFSPFTNWITDGKFDKIYEEQK